MPPPQLQQVGETLQLRLPRGGRFVIIDEQGEPLFSIDADRAAIEANRVPLATEASGHPDLAAHEVLGLALGHDHPYAGAGHDHDGEYEPPHAHPYAATAHNHAIADSTGLQGALDGKASASHNHVDGDLPAGLTRDAELAAAIAQHVIDESHDPQGGVAMADVIDTLYPVGSLYVSTQPSAHADHTLSGAIAGEAAHTHAYTQVVNHVHPLATGTGSTGNFSQVIGTVDTSSGGTGGTPTQTALGTLSGNPSGGVASGTTAAGSSHTHGNGTLGVSAHGAHTGAAVDAHAVTQPSAHSDHAAQAHTVGQASAHADLNVVQPYVVVFMWKRTA